MKVFLKIISPKLSASLQKEFTIEDNMQTMTILEVVKKLENVELVNEIIENGSLSSQYICLVNNEIIMYDRRNDVSLKDGDNMIISFAIAGG